MKKVVVLNILRRHQINFPFSLVEKKYIRICEKFAVGPDTLSQDPN